MRSGQGSWLRIFYSGQKLSAAEAAFFFEDLSNMLSAGLSLGAALRCLEGASGSRTLARACAHMLRSLDRGLSLGQAMGECGIFEECALRALNAAGKAGQISRSARALAEYYHASDEVGHQLAGAMGYPLFVLVILLLVAGYISFEIVPRLGSLLPQSTFSGPLTGGMLRLACTVRMQWPFWLGIVLLIVGGLWLVQRTEPLVFSGWQARCPFVGRLIRDRELAMGFFLLSLMLKSGITLDESLAEAAVASGGRTRYHMNSCRTRLVSGQMLSSAFLQDAYFPSWVGETLRVGELSGCLDEYFFRGYQLCRRSLESRVKRVVDFLQPALILLCAGVMALLVFAFFRPLYGNLANIGMMHP
jgi:type II secretory pathway component PulF